MRFGQKIRLFGIQVKAFQRLEAAGLEVLWLLPLLPFQTESALRSLVCTCSIQAPISTLTRFQPRKITTDGHRWTLIGGDKAEAGL